MAGGKCKRILYQSRFKVNFSAEAMVLTKILTVTAPCPLNRVKQAVVFSFGKKNLKTIKRFFST